MPRRAPRLRGDAASDYFRLIDFGCWRAKTRYFPLLDLMLGSRCLTSSLTYAAPIAARAPAFTRRGDDLIYSAATPQFATQLWLSSYAILSPRVSPRPLADDLYYGHGFRPSGRLDVAEAMLADGRASFDYLFRFRQYIMACSRFRRLNLSYARPLSAVSGVAPASSLHQLYMLDIVATRPAITAFSARR